MSENLHSDKITYHFSPIGSLTSYKDFQIGMGGTVVSLGSRKKQKKGRKGNRHRNLPQKEG